MTDGAPRRPRLGRRPGRDRAVATPTTGASAPASRPSAGRSGCTPLPGGWPHPDAHDLSVLAGELEAAAADALVLLDGLVARQPRRGGARDAGGCASWCSCTCPSATRWRVRLRAWGRSRRARPGGRASAGARLRGSGSDDERVDQAGWLVDTYDLDPTGCAWPTPGATRPPPATGTPTGADASLRGGGGARQGPRGAASRRLALGARTSRGDCVCAGSLDRDPDHVARLRDSACESGIADRVTFAGPLVGDDLERAYAAADLLVVASRIETYGLVVTEALAHGAARRRDVRGRCPRGDRAAPPGAGLPGLLVPPARPRSWVGRCGPGCRRPSAGAAAGPPPPSAEPP